MFSMRLDLPVYLTVLAHVRIGRMILITFSLLTNDILVLQLHLSCPLYVFAFHLIWVSARTVLLCTRTSTTYLFGGVIFIFHLLQYLDHLFVAASWSLSFNIRSEAYSLDVGVH